MPGTSYTVAVRAINSVGRSDATAGNQFTTSGASAPSPPQEMTLTDITTTSVTISWLASASDGGSSIRYYQVLMYVPPL